MEFFIEHSKTFQLKKGGVRWVKVRIHDGGSSQQAYMCVRVGEDGDQLFAILVRMY